MGCEGITNFNRSESLIIVLKTKMTAIFLNSKSVLSFTAFKQITLSNISFNYAIIFLAYYNLLKLCNFSQSSLKLIALKQFLSFWDYFLICLSFYLSDLQPNEGFQLKVSAVSCVLTTLQRVLLVVVLLPGLGRVYIMLLPQLRVCFLFVVHSEWNLFQELVKMHVRHRAC